MRSARAAWVPWLLVALAGLGLLALFVAPQGANGTGVWPIGLGTASLVLTPRRRIPLVVVLIGLIALATLLLDGRGAGSSVGFAVAIVVECVLSWWILCRPALGERPPLRSDADLRRFLTAIVLSSATGGALSGLTALLVGEGVPWRVGAVVGLGHLVSQLILVPLVTRLHDHPALARRGERIVQWGAALILAPILFSIEGFPSLAVLMIPFLAWGAARCRPVEALMQQGVVLTIAIGLTSLDLGPFSEIPSLFALPPDARSVSINAFALACGSIVLPLVLRVSEQVSAAGTAATQRDLLQRVLDGTSGVAIIGTDAAGLITLFNPGAERLLGYRSTDVLGRPALILHTKQALVDKAAELGVKVRLEDIAVAMTQPGAVGGKVRFRRADGVEREHQITVSRLTDQDGVLNGWVSTSEDITEETNRQRSMEEAVERLRDLDALKDSFVSTVSHELRTPITSIRGYLEMLNEGEFGALEPQQALVIERVSRNGDRLLQLIDELLTLARVDDDGSYAASEVIDLRDVVRAGFDQALPGDRARGPEVTVDLSPHALWVTGDPDLLERVLVNVIGNAVKFTGAEGSVRVSMHAGDGRGPRVGKAVVVVSDTGPGIPADEIDQLFTRFFRSSITERAATPGTGLGLAIAESIVSRHGGRIEVESEVGVGTTFRVVLPLHHPGNVQHSTTVEAYAAVQELP